MNPPEVYKRAAQDAAFRHATLEHLRQFKYLSLALIWLCVLVAVGFAAWGFVRGARSDSSFGVLLVAAFSWIPYLYCVNRITELKALETAIES